MAISHPSKMKKIQAFLLSVFITLMSFVNAVSQTTQDSLTFDISDSNFVNNELKGLVLDIENQAALSYANIYVLHKNKGAITNEKGSFSIDISDLDKNDTLRFQYIGYKTRKITIAQLDTTSVVYLKEEIINLSEILIFGSNPDPVSIVKKVLEYKDSNYKKTTSKKQIFIRERQTGDADELNLNYKKSSITELDEEMIALVEEKIPKNTTSYSDFLGYLYFSENEDDSITLKVDPVRAVSLKDKDLDDLEQLGSIFEKVLTDTQEEEYWKVKTGIFSQKLDMDDMNNDTIKDTTIENSRNLYYYGRGIQYRLEYSLLDNKKEWEFLHSTGKYNYTIAGGTRVNGEDVYIIDFKPKRSGNYVGRMYISINTFALIRADYEYAPGAIGRDFHLLGVGYTENQFSGSIYFEKKDGYYSLKYFSRKAGMYFTVDRNIALLKKKERFLFDKKLNEIKIGLELAINVEDSFEYLVLDDMKIHREQFADFEQKKRMEVIYVDQFDDKLWQGFSIIEPTKQMREYKKQEVN